MHEDVNVNDYDYDCVNAHVDASLGFGGPEGRCKVLWMEDSAINA